MLYSPHLSHEKKVAKHRSWPLLQKAGHSQKTGWYVAPFANRLKAYKSTHHISRNSTPVLFVGFQMNLQFNCFRSFHPFLESRLQWEKWPLGLLFIFWFSYPGCAKQRYSAYRVCDRRSSWYTCLFPKNRVSYASYRQFTIQPWLWDSQVPIACDGDLVWL